MAKSAKKSVKRAPIKQKSSTRRLDARSILFLLVLLIGILLSVFAVIRPTELRQSARGCSLDNCNQCASGGNYIINNLTNCPAEPDGDQQVCSFRGRVGLCGGNTWCCPGPGQQWSRDMTACAGNTYEGPCVAPATPTPTRPPATHTPTRTPTPNPTSTPRPTNTPTNTPTRTPTPTRRPTGTPRPTSTPYPTSTLRATAAPTPTPIPALSDVCGKSCSTDSDCQLGLACTNVFVTLKGCRNRVCPDKPGCLCDDSTGGSFFFATPTPGPGGASMRSLPLTIGDFTDRKGQTGENPTISGITEPDAKVTITVYPDGIGGEVIADKNGKWSYKFTKKLSPGTKNLLIIATKPDGQTQASKQFTVVGGAGFNFGWIILIMVLGAIGFGAYVYVKSNQ